MISVQKCSIPANTLLEKYATNGGYSDCYSTEIPVQVSLSEFISAFYTTSLFKLERSILAWTVSKPSTDQQARQLSEGEIQTFAAWHVENQNENELLMCDFPGRTRSWLMVIPISTVKDSRTKLYFGSAVVPIRNRKTGKSELGWVYRSLLGFHRIYSRLLLYFAARKLVHQGSRRA